MTSYNLPDYLEAPRDQYDLASNIAHFLLANSSSIYGSWVGNIRAKDQRILFGRFLGKGRLFIDGDTDTVEHVIKVAFGQDFHTSARISARPYIEDF